MKTKREELESEIQGVEMEEVMVATNSGTFGSEECCRVTGTGDSAAGTWMIYERVGDSQQSTGGGCDPDDAPGRRIDGREALIARRRHLSDLRAQLRCLPLERTSR